MVGSDGVAADASSAAVDDGDEAAAEVDTTEYCRSPQLQNANALERLGAGARSLALWRVKDVHIF